MNKILRIFSSRLKTLDLNKKIVKDRLTVCQKCPFNTDNMVKKTFKAKIQIKLNKILNFLTDTKVIEESTCSVCGCMLVFKASNINENCPKNKWN